MLSHKPQLRLYAEATLEEMQREIEIVRQKKVTNPEALERADRFLRAATKMSSHPSTEVILGQQLQAFRNSLYLAVNDKLEDPHENVRHRRKLRKQMNY
jgi:hypothetical protein